MRSASSSAPGRKLEARLGERLDAVGDDRRAAVPDRLEQVAVRHQAQALIPRVVARLEVRVDVVTRRELVLERFAQERLHRAPACAC